MTTAAKPRIGASPPEEHWDAIEWQSIERQVLRLQMRIAKAVREGRWGKVKSLQWLLTHSFAAKLLAVRRVTQNAGRKTAGVDGTVWKTAAQKLKAARSLQRRSYRTLPLRRVYIPKKNGRLRSLGIPAMSCRAMQALYLQALEPIAETLADPNSYGFRPKRSTADAIGQCFNALCSKHSAEWIFEGDIKACFDRLSHTWLQDHIPMDKLILGKWLAAGYMEEGIVYPTEAGSPQGGIITPHTLKVISSLSAWSRDGGHNPYLICVSRSNMFMTDEPIHSGGQGATAERCSPTTRAQYGVVRSCAKGGARVRSVFASSISVPGGSRAAGPAGRDYRGDGADDPQAPADHGAGVAGVRETQRSDHRNDRHSRSGRLSGRPKKAWLSDAQGVAYFKCVSTMRLIDCVSPSLRRRTTFWSPDESASSARG